MIGEDIVGIRARKFTSAVLTLLFFGSDIRGTQVFYPAHVVLKTPSWCSTVKAGSSTYIACHAKWATCVFTSPVVAGSNDELYANDKSAREEYEKAMDLGEEPSSEVTETVEEFEKRTGQELGEEHIGRVIWAFIKWDDLLYEECRSYEKLLSIF